MGFRVRFGAARLAVSRATAAVRAAGVKLRNTALARLAQSLQHNHVLQTLSLEGNKFGVGGVGGGTGIHERSPESGGQSLPEMRGEIA